jgi:hypothetical protein
MSSRFPNQAHRLPDFRKSKKSLKRRYPSPAPRGLTKGKYLLRKLGVEGRVEAKLGEEVVGSGGAIGGRLVLSVDEDVGDLHALAKGLLSKVKTKSW